MNMVLAVLACTGPSPSTSMPEQGERLSVGMDLTGTTFGVGETAVTLPIEGKYTILEAVRTADW
jgi:hypothetical protein